MEALKAWRCFLYGAAAPIDIYTDHHSLQWINTQPNLSARQSRWVEQLQDYSFKVHHLAGDRNGAADALSRRVTTRRPMRQRPRPGLGRGMPRQSVLACGWRRLSSRGLGSARP